MKKKVLGIALLMLIVLVTGCGGTKGESDNKKSVFNKKQTMTCTQSSSDSDGYSTSNTVVVTYDSKKVYKAKSTTVTEIDPEYAEFQTNIFKAVMDEFNVLDGIDASFTQDGNLATLIVTVEYDKLNEQQINDTLDGLMDGAMFTKKNYTIEEFKAENLTGYECK